MPTNKEIVNKLLTTDKDQISDAYGQPQAHRALEDQISDKAPLKEEDFIEEGQTDSNSIFKIASEEIDIDKDISDYFNNLKNTNLWNESVKSAISNFVNRFLSSSPTIPIVDGSSFSINDIRKANAGKSFSGEPWVRPKRNIDGSAYKDVRGNDAIESVLNNVKELQFTRTQDQAIAESEEESKNKYIRLLMPKNTRRVEVEDLDRNFWVIGQTLAGVSAFLFDTNSPLIGTLQNLLSEVQQLWENVLYLWVDLWAETNLVTKVHSEVVYLSNSQYSTQMKFDNFDTNITEVSITNRLQYLIDMYPKCNLCIVPILRNNNYFKNYYQIERYYGIWLYDRNKEKWTIVKFTKGSSQTISSKYAEIFSNNRYLDVIPKAENIFGLMTDENNYKYKYLFPLSNASDLSDVGLSQYIGGIRTSQSLYCSYTVKEGFSGYCTLILSDYVSHLIYEPNVRYKEQFSQRFEQSEATRLTFTKINEYYSDTPLTTIDINKGFYLGEIPTTLNNTTPIELNLKIREINLPPIIEPAETIFNYRQNGTAVFLTNLRDYSVNTLEKINLSPDNEITLYTGTYRSNIFASKDANAIENVYDKYGTFYSAIGGENNFYPAFNLQKNSKNAGGELTNPYNTHFTCSLGGANYDETKQEGQYWNRFREMVRLGCVLKVPGLANESYDDYFFWWVHVGTKNPTSGSQLVGKHSLIPLYKDTEPIDKKSAGRRGTYWYFYTIYQNGSSLTKNNWAIKLTEVFMNYAPTTDGGYQPAKNRTPSTKSITLGGTSLTYKVGGCCNPNNEVSFYTGTSSNNILYNFAPIYIRGRAGATDSQGNITYGGTQYSFFPMVTMITTHIFKPEGVAQNIRCRIHTDGAWDETSDNSYWTTPKLSSNYNTYNTSLSNYTIVNKGSSLTSDEIDKINNIFTKVDNTYSCHLKNQFNHKTKENKPDHWLDFERWPLRGFGPKVTGNWTTPIEIYDE